MTEQSPADQAAQRQRRAIAWGAGLFLGLGIGGAIALALDAWLMGALLAAAITVVVALAYLMAGYGSAEKRAARIVACEQQIDEDEDDDGTY